MREEGAGNGAVSIAGWFLEQPCWKNKEAGHYSGLLGNNTLKVLVGVTTSNVISILNPRMVTSHQFWVHEPAGSRPLTDVDLLKKPVKIE
jgi:hypothetical protein